MKANVGAADRILRAVVGVALIGWAVMGGPVWAWIGIVPLGTAVFRFCPAYTLFGFSSCPIDKKH